MTAMDGNGKAVDVLAVMDRNALNARNRKETARTMRGADARLADLREQEAAHVAVFGLVKAVKWSLQKCGSNESCEHCKRLRAALAAFGDVS